jgi:capsular polysaccharide biosynthesis protein
VYYSFLAFPWGANLHPTLSFPYLGKKKMMLKKAIFLITPEAKANYYHWVIDLLPRLLLTQEYQMQDFPDYQIILHHPERKYEESTLALLGIEKHKVVRLKSFEFAFVETLIITDFVTHDKSFPTWKKKLLNQIKVLALNNSPQSNIKKIYLRRGNQRKRRLIREEDLVIELTRKGFHSINLEDLTFVQQVRLLENAEVVIALHGAALTNIIFCKENTLIIELRSKVSPPEFYSIIAKAYGLRFETILLEPKYKISQQHLANKEDLIITKQDERLLFTKLQEL